ncbi:MAG: hypothetical protein WBV23_12625 [Desulfobaccales bacterium]
MAKLMDFIELEIKSSLEEIPGRAQTEQWIGETPWTKGVKQAIVNVGRKFSYLTAASGTDSDEGQEWLYDIVWYQSDNEKYMTDVPLVAECEWGGEGAIKYDFEKLLISRSPYKLMIFQSDSDKNINDIINKMKIWITNFRQTSKRDRYLFAGWSKTHWMFEHYIVA